MAAATETIEVSLMRPFGIGFSNRGGRCIIKDVVPDKNADRAGVMKGDLIERINDCTDKSHEGMMAYLKSQPKHLSSRFVLIRSLKGHKAELRAVVAGAMNVSIKNQRFTVFRIAMSNKSGSWLVHKRYSEFEQLNKLVGGHTPAKLPGKKLFGSSTEAAVVKERMVGLNDYLQLLLSNDAVACSDPVDDFLGKDQELYPDSAVIEQFDSGLSDDILAMSGDGSEKLSSLRRQAIAEAGKIGAERLGNVTGLLSDQAKELSDMEQKKLEIDKQLFEATTALNDQLQDCETSITARQEMCNFMKMYSLKLHGVKSDYSTELEQEKRKMNRPTGRLHSELEDLQRVIGRIKDGLTELRAQKETQAAENKRKGLEIQEGIDATKRTHEARSRLKNHLNILKQGLDREIEEIKAAIEENEAEAVNMTAFHKSMVRDAEELGKTQELDKVKIVELEEKEQSLIEDNDQALAELRAKLHIVEANLGAWAEMEALRGQHEEEMSSLRNQSVDNKNVIAIVDEELDRSRAQSEVEQKSIEENNAERELILNQMEEQETNFVEELKNIRSTINAQVTSAARTDEYFEKVKGELEFAEENLRTHNVEKHEFEACLDILQGEAKSQGDRIKGLDQEMATLQQELQQQQNRLNNHTLVAKGEAEDLLEQIDDEQQLLNAKEEAQINTKQQLQELEGTPEQKAKFALLEAYVREVCAESDTIDGILKQHETAKAELDNKQCDLQEELKTTTERLEKESRDVQYRIEVDSRAMQLRADYAQELGEDVSAAENIQGEQITSPSSGRGSQSQPQDEDHFEDARED